MEEKVGDREGMLSPINPTLTTAQSLCRLVIMLLATLVCVAVCLYSARSETSLIH